MLAATFAVGCLVLCLRTPDLAKFARTADHKLELRERLSTALDVDARLPPDAPLNPVCGALLTDVESRAPAIDPRAIVRFGVPRAIWLLPVLAVITALLHEIPVGSFSSHSPAAGPRDSGTLSGDAAEKAGANLRRIADLLDQDAQRRVDPYLRTIARALQRLGTEVEHANLDRRELASALDQLLAHSRQAYAQIGSGDRGEARAEAVDLLAAAHDDILTPDRTAAAPQPDIENVGAATPAAGERAASSGTPPDSSSPRSRRQVKPDATLAPRSLNGAADQANVQKDGDEYGDLETDPRTQKERTFAEQQRRMRAAAEAVGAAADAGAGEGDRAGNGTRPLGNDIPNRTDLAPGADMLLPDQAGNDGRRIRIELTPQTALSDVAPPAASSDRNWRHSAEQPVARPTFDVSDQKVVGRYFTPPAESSGR